MFVRPRKAQQEEGFTLIELLVVIIIIGILAAIAVPVFANQRTAAYDASVKSDVNATVKQVEGLRARTGEFPTSITGVRLSPGNTIAVCGGRPV